MFQTILKTSPGRKFIDVEAKHKDGSPAKLSDYVGKGKYVLVDYWASWCRPCRQIGRDVLKPLYERLKDDDRIEFLSVAVWDKDEHTLKALEEEGYPWQQLIGAGEVPMEKYGFNGVPMIMLIGPDGTIINRELGGQSIEPAINKALSGK